LKYNKFNKYFFLYFHLPIERSHRFLDNLLSNTM